MALYIYGAGGMAEVIADTAMLLGYDILGFVDDTPNARKRFLNREVLSVLPSHPKQISEVKVICAIGDCDARLAVCSRLANAGYRFATLVHPSAVVSPRASLGKGVFIAAGAVVDPSVTIGDFCIINKNSVISHGSVIGRASHLAPAAAIAGNCDVGEATWIGLGAKIIEKRHIAQRTFIGAGAIVIRDTNPNTLVYGVPATEVKMR